jgi:hypothetical protein
VSDVRKRSYQSVRVISTVPGIAPCVCAFACDLCGIDVADEVACHAWHMQFFPTTSAYHLFQSSAAETWQVLLEAACGDVLALQSHAALAYSTKIHGCLFRIGESSTIPDFFQPLSGNTREKMLVRLKGHAHRHGRCCRGSGIPAESC